MITQKYFRVVFKALSNIYKEAFSEKIFFDVCGCMPVFVSCVCVLYLCPVYVSCVCVLCMCLDYALCFLVVFVSCVGGKVKDVYVFMGSKSFIRNNCSIIGSTIQGKSCSFGFKCNRQIILYSSKQTSVSFIWSGN